MQLAHWFHDAWPHLVLAASLLIGVCAAVHATMNKRDVRGAIGWVGVVMLSPILGALLYVVAGVNRVRVRRLSRQSQDYPCGARAPVLADDDPRVGRTLGAALAGQKILGDRVAGFPLLGGNRVTLLPDGDSAYEAMLQAIGQARHCVALQSYIFDHDAVGQAFARALAGAHGRGVQVRVLVDAVGETYSRPPIGRLLRQHKVPYARFRAGGIGLRWAYANLRSHRKLLVVDGRTGFTGGMNIRQEFSRAHAGAHAARDAHFRLEGPVLRQLMSCFAHDWALTTGQPLHGWDRFTPLPAAGSVLARCVASGPDQPLGCTHAMLMGALAAAQRRVLIQTPYFLPDVALVAALATTARRGVAVDIVIPGRNNLRLVDYAMTAQLDQVLEAGCRVWRTGGGFDHSKLMTVDGAWAFMGSSNLDPRSLRLNFELDVELYDPALAGTLERRIQAAIGGATEQTLELLMRQPFLPRLRNRLAWLASPYL